MKARTQVVFLGPSLARNEAQQILPDAIFLPPAAMGDIVGALRRYRPHSIGLVDGTFLQNMSVFHKELLYAMDSGAYVLGSSSMGALRAAECAHYGMIGIGEIYQAFATGELENDADVALTHADVDAGYRPLSDAMVTIRAVLRGSQAAGLLTARQSDELIARQEQRWFPERRVSDSLADAAEIGVTGEKLTSLREFLQSHTLELDPKRRDAIALLEAMRDLPDHPPQPDLRPQTVMSGVFQAMLARDVVVETEDGHATTFDRIRRYAGINETDYEDVMRAARANNVLAQVAFWFGGEPTQDEIDRARQHLAHQWAVGLDQFEERAYELDLDSFSLRELLAREALVLRMLNSYLGRPQHGTVTRLFLDELRKRGRYQDVKHAAALQESLARSVIASADITPQQAVATHASLSQWDLPTDFVEYVEQNDLGSVAELLQTIRTSVLAFQALFGTGLLPEVGEGVDFYDNGEPMMTRGR